MKGQTESLANRLVEENERSCQQRQHFEEQRTWLIAQLKSISFDREMQPRRKPNSPHQNVDGSIVEPVEDRLLAYGRHKAERLAKAREVLQKERDVEEQELQQTVALRPNVKRTMSPSLFQNKQEILHKRLTRHKQLVENSMPELTFQPRISAESARLAQERRTKEHLETAPIVDVLFQRNAVANDRIVKMREEQNTPSNTPRITSKAKNMELPFTASERLYMHAKERHVEEREMEERLRDVVEDNFELTFHPSISRRAERLQRKPGRFAHDDLYEHGVQHQRRRSASTSDGAHIGDTAFHPIINKVSAFIATRLDESTTERLLRPRQGKQAEDPISLGRSVRSNDLDRHFDELYSDVSTRAARQQRAVQAAQDLGPEYTFAPKINHKRPPRGLGALPLDERMHLWQERRNRRLAEARERLEEKDTPQENTPKRRRGPPTYCWTGYTHGDKSGDPTSVAVDGYNNERKCVEAAVTTTTTTTTRSSSIEHSDVIQEALRALENAERVSRYITVD